MLPERLGLQSTTDSDCWLACTRKNNTKNPLAVDCLQKEQIAGLLFENKIKRYPLRNYVNLSTRVNMQCRPNYYESEQEPVWKRRRKRRHSVSAPRNQKIEEEEEKRPNLKCNRIGPRRHSQGAPVSSWRGECEVKNSDVQTSNEENCCAILSRVLTYTSKKGVVKFIKTKQLNEELSHSSLLGELIKDDNSVFNNKRPELESSLDKFDWNTVSSSEQCYAEKIKSLNGKGILNRTNNVNLSVSRSCEDRGVQNETEKTCSDIHATEQTNFLAQWALQRHPQNKLDQATCKEIQTKNVKNKITQTKGRSYLEKEAKIPARADKPSTCTSVSQTFCGQIEGETIHTNSKSHDATQIATKKCFENPSKTIYNPKNATVKIVKDKKNIQQGIILKHKDNVLAKQKNHVQNEVPKYKELLQEHRENLFKPDLLLRKDAVLVKIPSKQPDNKNVKKPNLSNTGLIVQKKISIDKPVKEKTRNPKHQNKIKKTTNVQAAVKNISLQKASATSKNRKPLYDIDEIERKLKQIFGEENENEDIEESGNRTNTVQDKCMDTSTKYCVLCKKKIKWEKRTNQELAKLKKRESLSKKRSSSAASTKKKADLDNITKEIKALIKKRKEVTKIKLILESLLCSKETCIGHCSGSTTKETKEKTKDAIHNRPVEKYHLIEDNSFETQNITHEYEDNTQESSAQILVEKGHHLLKKKSNPRYLNKSLVRKPVENKKPPQQNSVEDCNLLKELSTADNVCNSMVEQSTQQNLMKDSCMLDEQLLCENVACEVTIRSVRSNQQHLIQDNLLEDQSNSQNSILNDPLNVENVPESINAKQIERSLQNLMEEHQSQRRDIANIEEQTVVEPHCTTETRLLTEQTNLENVPHNFITEEQITDKSTQQNSVGDMYMPNEQLNVENVPQEPSREQNIEEQSQPNFMEQFLPCLNITNDSVVKERACIEQPLSDSMNNPVVEEQSMEESTETFRDRSNGENVPHESVTEEQMLKMTSGQDLMEEDINLSKNPLNHENDPSESANKEEKCGLSSCCFASTMTECSANKVKFNPEDSFNTNSAPKQEELPTSKCEKFSPKHSYENLEESDLKEKSECCCCLKKEEKPSESTDLFDNDLATEQSKDSNEKSELETNIIISDDEENEVQIISSSLPEKSRRNCFNQKCKNCFSANNHSWLGTDIIILDDEEEITSTSSSLKKNCRTLSKSKCRNFSTEDNSELDNDVIILDEDDDCLPAEVRDTFRDKSEDKNVEELTTAPTNSTKSTSTGANETKGIDSSLATKLTTDDVLLRMTDMEHYKKRLIHQHEKPDTLSPPCTTTEEDDDSLESSLSPASSIQSRESGQQEKKKDEVVQKVARKRAICRSQFRHQSMEIFKLGSSIPTSLCKTKEPYNVCTEKNLQMCYQNGTVKKGDRTSSKGLTESIINTMEGGKRRDVPLWRSTSLNSDTSDKQIVSNNNSSSGRHILPAIVPELPERRKTRVKSLPESSGKNVKDDSETNTERERSVAENTSTENRAKDVQQTSDTSKVVENVTEAHSQNSTVRRQSTSSESDTLDCAPINLSMKNRDTVAAQPWTELLNTRQAKIKEVNSSHHPTSVIPKQPSNIPKKPTPQSDESVPRSVVEQNVANLEGTRVDKDGNCYFLTSIPTEALDPQKKSNLIVITFPQIQQQMARMEAPAEMPQSPMEVMDSPIMSLINIVRSSVETAFNPMSLPVLNRLYVDLNRYLLLPTVSDTMKLCIEDALNLLITYLLVNWFRAPQTLKTRDFVHRLLQLDLRPHLEFLSRSLEVIHQRIKNDDFREHLLHTLSRRSQEAFPRRSPNDLSAVLPPQRQYFPSQNQRISPEFREYPPGHFWPENLVYQRGNVNATPHPNLVGMGNIAQSQQQQRNRRQPPQPEANVLRGPDGFNGPNLAMMRTNLNQTDNRCIPPNNPLPPEAAFMNAPTHVASKGRPRTLPRVNKQPIKPPDTSTFGPPALPPAPVDNKTPNRWTKPIETFPTNSVPSPVKGIRRNSDVSGHRSITEDNSPLIKKIRQMEERRVAQEMVSASDAHGNVRNALHGNSFQQTSYQRPEISKNCTESSSNQDNPKVASIPAGVSSRDDEMRRRVENHKSKPETVVPAAKDLRNSNTNDRDTVLKQCANSDVEQFLQTNVIVNSNQNNTVIRESVMENLNLPKVNNKSDNIVNCDGEKVANLPEKLVTNKNRTTSSEVVKSVPETSVEKQSASNRSENCLNESGNRESVYVSNTVIIKDESMEISKGNTALSGSNTSSGVKNSTTDLDDVVLERVTSNVEVRDGVSPSSGPKKSEKLSETEKGVVGEAQKLLLEEDVSIEKVTNKQDTPPELFKLTILKRKTTQDEKQSKKKVKWRMQGEILNDDIVIIEDDDKETATEKLDYNQNDVTKTKKVPENDINKEKSPVTPNKQPEGDKVNDVTRTVLKPIIEDISDEETFEPFRLYSTYENKINGDPRKILQTTEVSHCKLIEGSVEAIQKANPRLFEKPPVYTRPVMPRKLQEERESAPKRKLLSDMVQYREDSDTMTCSLSIRKDSNTLDMTRFSPPYKMGAENPRFSPAFKPTSQTGVVQMSPSVPKSPLGSPNFKATPQTGVVQMSPGVPKSPLGSTPQTRVVQMSPNVPKSPVASPIVQSRLMMAPTAPIVPNPATNHISPAVTSPVYPRPAPPPLDESRMNWSHWFAEEQRKGVFNFERSQSTESNYGSKFPDESFFEIEIDSKMRRIRKSLYDKIPKGKLCYVRESNTFIRYFDDNQMELFIRNLNMEEKSPVAKNLLRQVRNSSDVVTPTETSGKGELIRLSKDVTFSSEDYLSDPELYVEEVEKVQRYVPKDFYGFYKFVTGYQIVNHHPPVSFQMFLTLHNTNGIRVLLKNYVSSLVEDRSVL